MTTEADSDSHGDSHGAAGAAASKGVLGRGSIYPIGTAAPILANLAVVPVVTRMLGKPGYGVVAIAIVVIQVAMMAGSFGMPSVITRHGILAQSGVAGARALLIRGSLMTIGLITAIILTAPLWNRLVQAPLRDAVLLARGASAVVVVVENSQALLRVLDRPGAFVSLSLTATLGGPLLGLALLAPSAPVRSPERYLVGLTAGYAAAAAVGLVLGLRGGHPQRDRGDTRAALRLGLPVIPHLVALFLANGALVFLAGQLFDIASAGRIQLALLVGSAPAVITSALNNSWAPIIYRTPAHERGAVLAHTARDITTLIALISGGVALLSPWLMRLVADAGFAPLELVPAVAIVAFGCVLSVAYLANVHLVFAAGRSLGLSVITPLSLLIGLGCAYLIGRQNLVLLAVGFPTTYAVLALGTAGLRRYLHAARWSETTLLMPAGIGLALCVLGAVLPASGAAERVRIAMATLAGLGTLRLGRRVLRRSP
ncbi:MAG: oligosaccharide flippase family protein [Phycicoccus sp.]|nr:oligosaccharide flippase family protein [Phycicoccus sp.]